MRSEGAHRTLARVMDGLSQPGILEYTVAELHYLLAISAQRNPSVCLGSSSAVIRQLWYYLMTRQTSRFLMPLSKVASSISRLCDGGCVCDDRKDRWWEAREQEEVRRFEKCWGGRQEEAGSMQLKREPTYYPLRPSGGGVAGSMGATSVYKVFPLLIAVHTQLIPPLCYSDHTIFIVQNCSEPNWRSFHNN